MKTSILATACVFAVVYSVSADIPATDDLVDLTVTDGDAVVLAGDAVLIYDPATGNVKIDASGTKSGKVRSFVFGTAKNNLRPKNAQFPFINTGTNTDAAPFQIGQTDALNLGQGPTVDLGDIFPAGMTSDVLAEYLTLREYCSEVGRPEKFGIRFATPK